MISVRASRRLGLSKSGNFLKPKSYYELDGLSTDTKPTVTFKGDLIGNGSVFLEMDTGLVSMYNEDSDTWIAL